MCQKEKQKTSPLSRRRFFCSNNELPKAIKYVRKIMKKWIRCIKNKHYQVKNYGLGGKKFIL